MTDENKEIQEAEEKKEIVKIENNIIRSIEDIRSIADVFYQSGLFSDVRSTAQAFVKIMAGNELGIGAFASMRNVYIIKGNTTLSAGLMASKVKAHPKYNYQIKHLDKKGCIISFFELFNDKWEHVGDSSFDESDAQDAGLLNKDNWKCYAKNMYFSRALSNGVRLYCPDVFYGTSVYTPEELSGDWVEGEGLVIEEEDLKQKSETQQKATKGNKRPYSAEELKVRLDKFQTMYKNKWDEDQIELYRKIIVINLEKCYAGKGSDMKRHEVLTYLFGDHSSKNLTAEQIYALHEWLSPKQDSGGDWNPDDMAVTEAQTLLTTARKEAGQMELTEDK